MYRFYAEQELEVGAKVRLSEEEHHHATSVLRVKPGEEVEIVNGRGALARAVFPQLQVTHVHHAILPQHKKILIQAYPQPAHLEWIIEKGTELGITHFWLFPSAKSELKALSESKRARLHKITISALKQCKRHFLPEISYYGKFDEIHPPVHTLLADPRGGPYTKVAGDVAFIVGPESGFTEGEIASFKAKPIKLSDNILRCETAAIVAAALLVF